jgi:molecular chaperone HtpG
LDNVLVEELTMSEMNVQDTTPPESLEYRTEVKQLLDILAHSLYTDREIFLRELISNASDALNRLQFEMLTNPDVVDADAEMGIWIEVDADAKTLVLRDSGIGMNREELITNLGTIAHSGAKSFLQNAGQGQTALEEIIGQFGVGFYSVFMVAEEVRVVSRSSRAEDHAWAWTSQGDSSFTLEPVEDAPRGTSIHIQLKEDAAEFANGWRIEQIVKKHSDYVSFPIYLVEMEAPEQAVEDGEAEDQEGDAKGEAKKAKEPRVINRRTAIWRQSPSKVQAEEYNDFYKQLTFDTNDPLLHVHMVADAPVNVRALLFVPSKRERGMLQMRPDHGLRLYSRKILIQNNNKDLLPDHYRFIDGVVDSDDLPLNVSREMVQSNPVMRQLKRALTNRLNRAIKELADEQPEKYLTFWEEFGVFIKEGVATDHANQEALTELLRFRSSKSDGKWISLADYVGRMKSDQTDIYFVLGEDLRSAARSPHLDYFRKHDIEVLYLVDPIDGWSMAMLREANGKPLRNIDDAGLDLPQDESAATDESTPALDQPAFDQLVARAVEILGDKVRGVQEGKQLVDSPVRLVSPADSFDRDIQRVLRLTEEGYETPKKLLELNRRHPMIVNLGQMVARGADEPLVDAAILQLFDNALLLEGLHANPVDMVERIQLLMAEAVAARAKEE